jgi:hypothetical protein
MKMMFDSVISEDSALNARTSSDTEVSIDSTEATMARSRSLTDVLGDLEFDLRSNIFGNLIRSNESSRVSFRLLTSQEETQRILQSNEEILYAIGKELKI